MRPPILWIAVGFGTGLWAGLGVFGDSGWGGRLVVGLPVLLGAAFVARRAPGAAAIGVAAVAGLVWGTGAVRARETTCAAVWTRLQRAPRTVAVVVRLLDPAPANGGIVDGEVVGGSCGGAIRVRWPEGRSASGGTAFVVAGRWLGSVEFGVLAARRVRLLDPRPRALVIARRAELDAATRERYSRSGLAHILSISGLHVGFLAGWLGVLLRRCRLSAVGRFVAATVLVCGYVWLLGLPPPAVRAAVMLVIMDVAALRQRVVAPRGTVGLAALAVMLVDPWAVRSIGAWQSVSAVAAVLWAGRACERPAVPGPVRVLAPAVAATLATAPITAYAFGTVAPIGVLANLLAIPLGAVAVPGLLIALLLSWVAPPLAALIASGAGLTLALLDLVARVAAEVPGGHIIMVAGWPAAALWSGVAAVAWWLWHAPRRPWLIGARVLFVVTVVSWTALLAAPLSNGGSLDGTPRLTVHFLDVGQGDAALIRTPRGRWVLVDGGPRARDRDAGRRVVVPLLRRLGVRELAVVVATHGHADHYGGLPAVLAAVPARLVLEPGEPIGEPLYLEFLGAVEAAGAEWRAARAGDRVELDGVTFAVLSPDSAAMARLSDVNEHSVVLEVRYGAARVVLAGDAGLPTEYRLAGRVGDVDVLKVGHHGSRSATSEEWLTELRPELAIVSVGRGNRYGHPVAGVLEALRRHGARVLRTDEAGTITFTIDSTRAYSDIRHHD